MKPVDLGFVEEMDAAESAFLTSAYFPSKVGGKPAWLAPAKLPTESDLTCPVCAKPMLFLLQVYTPSDDDGEQGDDEVVPDDAHKERGNPEAYHRTVYVFCCKNGGCHKAGADCFKVLRCQLPRENAYYGPNANDEPETEDTPQGKKRAALSSPLCSLCGCSGPKKCGQCGIARYCSREHQVVHWSNGHKEECVKKAVDPAAQQKAKKVLFAEFELVTEPEGDAGESKANAGEKAGKQPAAGGESEDGSESDGEGAEAKRMKDYHETLRRLKLDKQSADDSADVEGLFDGTTTAKEDECFAKFEKRVARNPDQVLRYQRNGVPLWICDDNMVDISKVPACSSCGAPRQFEFQVMPQLLYFLKVDDVAEGPAVDWGVLLVFTCSRDCVSAEKAYLPEHLARQNVSDKGALDLHKERAKAAAKTRLVSREEFEAQKGGAAIVDDDSDDDESDDE